MPRFNIEAKRRSFDGTADISVLAGDQVSERFGAYLAAKFPPFLRYVKVVELRSSCDLGRFDFYLPSKRCFDVACGRNPHRGA